MNNLVLLENAEHTNSTNKKAMYQNSKIYLVKDVLEKLERFDIHTIQERHDKLLDKFYTIVTKKKGQTHV